MAQFKYRVYRILLSQKEVGPMVYDTLKYYTNYEEVIL